MSYDPTNPDEEEEEWWDPFSAPQLWVYPTENPIVGTLYDAKGEPIFHLYEHESVEIGFRPTSTEES